MENSKNTRKHEKQKMVIRTGGDGVGAVLVWGGVAVITALASVSAINKLRKRPANKSQNPSSPPAPALISSTVELEKLELNNNDDQGKDLSVLPQDSSPHIDCYRPRDGIADISATQLIDSKSSDLTKSLILDDDNPLLDMDVQNESRGEGLNEEVEVTPQVRVEGKGIEAASSGDLFVKAFAMNTTEMDKQEVETAIMNQRADLELEINEVVIKEDEEVEATLVGRVEAEDGRDDHDIQSIEETIGRKYDEDNEIAEKGEESSVERIGDNSQLVMTFTEKATDDENEGGEDEEKIMEKGEEGRSSTNGEAIWRPAQSVEELPVEHREMKINQQTLEADDENEGGEEKEEMMEKGEEESEAIWSAQLVEELPLLEHREMKINQQTLEEREDGDRKVKKEERSCCCSYDNSNVKDGGLYYANGNNHHYYRVKGKPAIKTTSLKEFMMRRISIDRIWIWSTSVLLLLLVAHLLLSPTRTA